MAAKPKFRDYAVIAGGDVNGLGVARALGRAKVPLLILDTQISKPTLKTRFGAKLMIRALSGPRFVDDLIALRAQFATTPVLILTQEASVATVASARDRLEALYHLTLSDARTVTDLLNKARFQNLAQRLDFPVPKAVHIRPESSIQSIDALRFPCVLKPTSKSSEYDRYFAKAYKVASRSEAECLWARMRNVVDEIIVQEWIEGSDSDIYFCLQYRKSGQQAHSFVGRKTLQWPPLVGGTASCIPAPEVATELTSLTERFFEAVAVFGLCSMEFKRDLRDGRFYMVEPTVGRTDYQEEIAVLNNANIPLAAYCGELGRPMPESRTSARPHGWRDPFACSNARRIGATDPAELVSSEIKMHDAYLRFDDPLPYLSLKLQAVHRRLPWRH